MNAQTTLDISKIPPGCDYTAARMDNDETHGANVGQAFGWGDSVQAALDDAIRAYHSEFPGGGQWTKQVCTDCSEQEET